MLPAGDLEYLFSSSIKEIAAFLAAYFFLLFCSTLAKKLAIHKSLMFSFFIVAATIFFIPAYGAKLELAVSILSATLCVIILALVGMIDLHIVDALFLFSLFLIPKRFFNSANMILGPGIHFLYILMIVLGYGKVKSGSLRGKFLLYYISFIYLSLVSYIFNTVSEKISSFYRESLFSESYLPLTGIPALFLLFCSITIFLCRKFSKQKMKLRVLGGRYPEIEKYLYLLTSFTVIVLLAAHIPFVMTRTSSYTLQTALSIFYIVLLIIQILFLILFYQLAYYRDALRFKDQEQMNEESYYLSLKKNLDSMADIRHDIKNIFLTMGNFVERSQDEEMKTFYKNKIFPFAMEEIEKNYLFTQLYQIPNETLRAFLHMKLFQAHSQRENIKISIQIDPDHFFLGMDIIDLTRILGILLDNALEECSIVSDSYIEIHIRNNAALCTYIIRNTRHSIHNAREQERGFSTKSGHTGLGLSIVQSIVDLYPLADLNTFSDQNIYVQSLNIQSEL